MFVIGALWSDVRYTPRKVTLQWCEDFRWSEIDSPMHDQTPESAIALGLENCLAVSNDLSPVSAIPSPAFRSQQHETRGTSLRQLLDRVEHCRWCILEGGLVVVYSKPNADR